MSKIETILNRMKKKAGDIWQGLKTVRNNVFYLVGSLTILAADVGLFMFDLEKLKVAFEDYMRDVRNSGFFNTLIRPEVKK